jgi:hypothetical protein
MDAALVQPTSVRDEALGILSRLGVPQSAFAREGVLASSPITGELIAYVRMRIIRVDSLEKVIEKLATTEKTTLAIAREEGGKIRVTSGSWDGEKVILKGQVLEVRNVDGRLYVSRKAKKPDEWDRPIPAYDPYGPGTGVAGDDDFVAGDA